MENIIEACAVASQGHRLNQSIGCLTISHPKPRLTTLSQAERKQFLLKLLAQVRGPDQIGRMQLNSMSNSFLQRLSCIYGPW